jgi:hypothetical protein
MEGVGEGSPIYQRKAEGVSALTYYPLWLCVYFIALRFGSPSFPLFARSKAQRKEKV